MIEERSRQTPHSFFQADIPCPHTPRESVPILWVLEPGGVTVVQWPGPSQKRKMEWDAVP